MATVRLYAGARAAAGVDECSVDVVTIDELVAALSARFGSGFERVLDASTLLVDGLVGRRETAVGVGAVIEVLPPFAGG
jgi:molybdopterin synthase sulfur carrier subunit